MLASLMDAEMIVSANHSEIDGPFRADLVARLSDGVSGSMSTLAT